VFLDPQGWRTAGLLMRWYGQILEMRDEKAGKKGKKRKAVDPGDDSDY
jgi:hypothetical protein